MDVAGNLYVGDTYNHRVRKVSAAGIVSTLAGSGSPGFSGDGGPATNASFLEVWGVAVDGTGNLYVADYWNNRIRKVNPGGVMSTFAGNGTYRFSGDGGAANAAFLNKPAGLPLIRRAICTLPTQQTTASEGSALRGPSPRSLETAKPGFPGITARLPVPHSFNRKA